MAGTDRGAQRSAENSVYRIRVVSHLDPHWSRSLGGVVLRHDADGTTMLEGTIRDQAALYGLLNRLRDLGLTLLTVQHLAPAAPTGSAPLAKEDPAHDPPQRPAEPGASRERWADEPPQRPDAAPAPGERS